MSLRPPPSPSTEGEPARARKIFQQSNWRPSSSITCCGKRANERTRRRKSVFQNVFAHCFHSPIRWWRLYFAFLPPTPTRPRPRWRPAPRATLATMWREWVRPFRAKLSSSASSRKLVRSALHVDEGEDEHLRRR